MVHWNILGILRLRAIELCCYRGGSTRFAQEDRSKLFRGACEAGFKGDVLQGDQSEMNQGF
jgi:hypothetical protein